MIWFYQQKHVLQVQLYYNDFETANPLGSKKGMPNLWKKYGFDEILKPLTNDET